MARARARAGGGGGGDQKDEVGYHLCDAEAHVARPDHDFHLEGVPLRDELRHDIGNGTSGTTGIIRLLLPQDCSNSRRLHRDAPGLTTSSSE